MLEGAPHRSVAASRLALMPRRSDRHGPLLVENVRRSRDWAGEGAREGGSGHCCCHAEGGGAKVEEEGGEGAGWRMSQVHKGGERGWGKREEFGDRGLSACLPHADYRSLRVPGVFFSSLCFVSLFSFSVLVALL